MGKAQPGMGAGKTETILLSSFNYSFLSKANGVRCAGWDSDHETSCGELNRAIDRRAFGIGILTVGRPPYILVQAVSTPQDTRLYF